MTTSTDRPSVISISSHVTRGSVGNRAAAFAFEAMGIHTWIVNTVQLPWHPGHGVATRIVPDEEQFSAYLEDLANSPWHSEVDAVLTGYMATESQVHAAAGFIQQLKSKIPNLLYLCDPVIGDLHGLYVPVSVAAAIKERLLPLCSVATPNRYELEWLTGHEELDDPAKIAAAARELMVPTLLVTSASGLMRGNIANILISGQTADMVEHREIAGAPNGPGDLTASVFLGHLLHGRQERQALAATTASVFEIVSRAKSRASEELMLETDAHSIMRPRVNLSARTLAV